MQRFWHIFRLGLLVVMFIGSGFYLLVTTPWAKYFLPRPSYAALVREGQPIVDAIYRFKAQRGLWPEYLDDLAPAFLPQPPRPTWSYIMLPGGPSLATNPRPGETIKVGYDFDPVKPSWRAVDGAEDRVLQIGSTPGPTTMPREKLIANELAELDRRIRADHDAMEQYRAKASFLKSLGWLSEARQTVAQAQAADANHFWPRLASVALDLEPVATTGAPAAGTPPPRGIPASLQDFDRWARDQPTFTKLYYLSLAYRLGGHETAALAAVEEAAKLPPAITSDDSQRTEFYLWDMARFALRRSRWDLVIKLADNWEKLQSDGRREEESYRALRAAAKLAKGDLAGAGADTDVLEKYKAITWAQNREALERAVKNGDKSFRYDAGDSPPPYQIFTVPE